MNGTCGLKKDTEKAMKLCKRAAELGNTKAQDELAFHYFNGYGDSDTTSCYKKSRYYAEKAADQGFSNSQYILARLLINSDWNHDEEAFQLMSLSAFQGSQSGRCDLAFYYEQMSQSMSSERGEAWKKSLLLSL
jgi:TPR repeat protein